MTENQQTPVFYGLLYIDDQRRMHANIRGKGDPIDIYLQCAILCAKSIAHHGLAFRLVTNDKRFIQARLSQLGLENLEVCEQKFSLTVPEGLRFWAAHFKVELYDRLGSGELGDVVGLIDIDTVMVKPIEFPQLAPGTLLGYDVTEQIVPEFGSEGAMISQIERLSGVRSKINRWFGGEFLVGHAATFRQLADTVIELWPTYIQNIEQSVHVGDELLLAAAVAKTRLTVIDAGKLGLIARWWTARTKFKQMSFDVAARRSILHLPSDKEFLANFAAAEFSPAVFSAQFRRAARARLLRRRLVSVAEILLGHETKYVARLS